MARTSKIIRITIVSDHPNADGIAYAEAKRLFDRLARRPRYGAAAHVETHEADAPPTRKPRNLTGRWVHEPE